MCRISGEACEGQIFHGHREAEPEAGKTTFLAAMSEYIPRDERLITIEDNAELRIRGIDNLVRLEAKMANMEGAVSVTIRDLIKSALRMRQTES